MQNKTTSQSLNINWQTGKTCEKDTEILVPDYFKHEPDTHNVEENRKYFKSKYHALINKHTKQTYEIQTQPPICDVWPSPTTAQTWQDACKSKQVWTKQSLEKTSKNFETMQQNP